MRQIKSTSSRNGRWGGARSADQTSSRLLWLCCGALALAALLLPTLSGVANPAKAMGAGTACTPSLGTDWLHTSGAWIVDSQGCEVRLLSVNWYGLETTNFVPAGLNFQPYKAILAEIKQLGFKQCPAAVFRGDGQVQPEAARKQELHQEGS